MPPSKSPAISLPAWSRIDCAGPAWCLSTHLSTVDIGAPSREAECNNAASSADERSCQWLSKPFASWRAPTEPPVAETTMSLDMSKASSHCEDADTGDHARGATPLGRSTVPLGSYRRVSPARARAGAVNVITSGLVEVETTGPLAARTEGTMIDEVFPDRGGPKTSTARSRDDHTGPRVPPPR